MKISMCDAEEITGLVKANSNYNSMYPGTTTHTQSLNESIGNPKMEEISTENLPGLCETTSKMEKYFAPVMGGQKFTVYRLWQMKDAALMEDFLKLVTGRGSDRTYVLCSWCWSFGDRRSMKKIDHRFVRSMYGWFGGGLEKDYFSDLSLTGSKIFSGERKPLFNRLIKLAFGSKHIDNFSSKPWPHVFSIGSGGHCHNLSCTYDEYSKIAGKLEHVLESNKWLTDENKLHK
jgi:hypothetical protein